jgi:hypothetical protein
MHKNLKFLYYKETVHHSLDYFIYNSICHMHLLNAQCIFLQFPPRRIPQPSGLCDTKYDKAVLSAGDKVGHDPVMNSVCYMKLQCLDIGNYFM